MPKPLKDSESVLRAIWPDFVHEDGEIDSAAFKLRRKEEGLSVHRTDDRSVDETVTLIRPKFYPCDSFAALSVPQCHATGAYIDPPEDEGDSHCQIYADDTKTPLSLIQSHKLAELARICYTPPAEPAPEASGEE